MGELTKLLVKTAMSAFLGGFAKKAGEELGRRFGRMGE